MDTAIIEFIQQQSLTHITCLDEESRPYSFSSFYSFDEKKACLYLKFPISGTQHADWLKEQPEVSGTIVMDNLDLQQLKGIQYRGAVRKKGLFEMDGDLHYHSRHPMATMIPGVIWILDLEWIKMTDYSLGLGTKTIWEKGASI